MSMEKHKAALSKISSSVAHYFQTSQPYRIQHGSTNSTRPRPSASRGVQFIDISSLCNVLSVNPTTRTALVEPNVPMDQLVTATLRKGLVPPVVMEFPGITAGGGFAGTAGESSSFRHGFFDQTVESVEMVLGNGEVVTARRRGEREDLFKGAAGAVGTLGITTLLELQLIEAKKWVKTTYHRTNSVREAVDKVRYETTKVPENDYVDGILFSKDHGVVITGTMTDEKPDDAKPQTFSGAWDPWFYLHVKDSTTPPPSLSASPPSGHSLTKTEYIPLAEYLFRYDRAGFWVGAAGFQYFRPVPFNRLTRWFLDDFLHTRMLYRALHGSGESARFIVQDLALPYDTAEEFVDYTNREFDIWPLWLCPLKESPPPTFHPHTSTYSPGNTSNAAAAAAATTSSTTETAQETEASSQASPSDARGMLNIGLWGWGSANPTTFISQNRALEETLVRLGGKKWLYAHTYYTEPEFWQTYQNHRPWYEALRKKYHAETLPTVYDKVRVKTSTAQQSPASAGAGPAASDEGKQQGQPATEDASRKGWRAKKPIGGLYGIWKSIQSGDYWLHRRAEWKYKG